LETANRNRRSLVGHYHLGDARGDDADAILTGVMALN
jgi:hypothetical protein